MKRKVPLFHVHSEDMHQVVETICELTPPRFGIATYCNRDIEYRHEGARSVARDCVAHYWVSKLEALRTCGMRARVWGNEC